MAAELACTFQGVKATGQVDDSVWTQFLDSFHNPQFGYQAQVMVDGELVDNPYAKGQLAFDWIMQRVFERAIAQNSSNLNSLKPDMDDYTFAPV